MDEPTVRENLRQFITRDLIRDEEYPLADDEGIITGGLMDSFSLAEFAVYVESEFDVYIPDADLTVDKMDTLDQMVARVLRDLPSPGDA
ncbi:MAG: acyl carrier protein [Chloroflexota bacterium]|jgi:acyl carrier protein